MNEITLVSEDQTSVDLEESVEPLNQFDNDAPISEFVAGGEKELPQPIIVTFDGDDDLMNPHNWTRRSRILCTCLVTGIDFIVPWAISIDSMASRQAQQAFNVSDITESLATGLFIIAFAFGSFIAGPTSEAMGRIPVYVGSLVGFMIFTMAAALAPNIGAQLTFRFIGGFFASGGMTCSGGSVADLWTATERTAIMPVFIVTGMLGSVLAPVAGGWIAISPLISWRWVEWVTLILSGVNFALILLFLPETYAPVLLTWKAKHLRSVMGSDRYKADIEVNQTSLAPRLAMALRRPFTMLIREPILIAIALYLVFVTVVLFTSLNGYGYVFADTYGLHDGMVGTTFAATAIGVCIPVVLLPLENRWKRSIVRKRQARGEPNPCPPETRLLLAMIAGPLLPISFLWLGWTNYATISPWSDLCAAALFGSCLQCLWLSLYAYLIDTYEGFAASAIGSVTLLRYVVTGIMVPVTIPMYENIGVHWSMTILGAVSLCMGPVPYVLYWFGDGIRARSKFAMRVGPVA